MIASVGADREGHSYNVNADEAAGAVARALRAYKVIFLTDVEGWLRDPRRPGSRRLRGRRRRGRGGARRRRRAACGPKLAGVRRRDPRRRHVRPHRRRPRAALAAARAVHRRRRRHEDPCRRPDPFLPTYARYPVTFVRGEGARLWDDEGNEYLDFLCGISVTSLGHCHPRGRRGGARAGRRGSCTPATCTSTSPACGWRSGWSSRSLGGGVFFTNSGAEANEAAIKLARKRRAGGEIVSVHGAFHGRTYGALSATPQESKQAPFAPLVPGLPRRRPTRRSPARSTSAPRR